MSNISDERIIKILKWIEKEKKRSKSEKRINMFVFTLMIFVAGLLIGSVI